MCIRDSCDMAASSEQKNALADFIAEDMKDLKSVLKAHQERQVNNQNGGMRDFYREKYRARYMEPVQAQSRQQQDSLSCAATAPYGSSQAASPGSQAGRESQLGVSGFNSPSRTNDGRWPMEQGPKNGGSPQSWRFRSR
eukprot:TRINITY_DN17712_c0_g1_i5.p3 TRINITY_DN17712_c0_g1~~TRINITY_DN17712_c0_g1_i5.p3  ORF type:complete len:139 (+),score=33.88 TRINITY_DN17712_c0_g1_i5:196-612(+)